VYDKLNPHPRRAKSSLVALVRRISLEHDRNAIKRADADVITWQTVADAVTLYGADAWGEDWSQMANEPSAPVALANVDTLRWFLRDHVDVALTEPLSRRDISRYAEAPRVLGVVEGVCARVCDILQERRWIAPLGDDGGTGYGGVDLVPPSGSRWWRRVGPREGKLIFMVYPNDERDDPPSPVPTVWVGIEFRNPARLRAEVLQRIRAADCVPTEDAKNPGRFTEVGYYASVADLIGGARSATGQATALADWIESRVVALIGLFTT
jgi:hypothetical protein